MTEMVTAIALIFHSSLMHYPSLILQSPFLIFHCPLSILNFPLFISLHSPFPIPLSYSSVFFDTLIPADCNVRYSWMGCACRRGQSVWAVDKLVLPKLHHVLVSFDDLTINIHIMPVDVREQKMNENLPQTSQIKRRLVQKAHTQTCTPTKKKTKQFNAFIEQ